MLTEGLSGNILKENLLGYGFTETEILNEGIVMLIYHMNP